MYQEYLNQLQLPISQLNTDELKDLLNNEEKLDEKVDLVLEILKSHKDALLTDNRTKAEQNIEKEPQLIELRTKVSELHEEGKTCCQAVQDKLEQIKDKSGNVSQEAALALLQTAAAESEEESEGLVKKFTENEINVEAFLESFLTARKSMHLRKLKAEKMQELMRRQSQANSAAQQQRGGGPAYSNFPTSGFYPTPVPSSGGVPYPMGGVPMMPMPPRPF